MYLKWIRENMINNRERIEWLNYWIEDADKRKKRILLIGDSVTRQYRKILNTLVTSQGYVVDVLAMSYNLLDEAIEVEIEHYLKTIIYKYKYIIFQLGAHHGHWICCSYNLLHRKRYAEKAEQVCELIQKYTDRLIIVSGTPEREKEKDGKKNYNNIEIEVRNDVMKKIAEKKGFLYVDLYEEIVENKFELIDCYHFTFQAYEHIAIILMKEIFHIQMQKVANRISHMINMKNYLDERKDKNLYIYGNGYRGKSLKKYLKKKGYEVTGFAVSEEYFSEQEDNTFCAKDVIASEDCFMIVTPEEYDLWRKLCDCGIDYVTLDERIYEYIDEAIILENM